MRLAGRARPEAMSAERTRSRDFSHRLVAEADDGEGDRAGGDLHLDVNRPCLHALEGHRRYARHHISPRPGSSIARTFAEQWPGRKGQKGRGASARGGSAAPYCCVPRKNIRAYTLAKHA